MTNQDWADKAGKKWRVNCTDIPKRLRVEWGCYLHNPNGEMIAIILPQDRPEAEGFIDALLDGLNRTSAPDYARLVEAIKVMILLVEDYEAKTCRVIRAAITIGKDDWRAEAKERELAMHKMFEFLDTLRAALADCKPEIKE